MMRPLNALKDHEDFRPVAPVVLAEVAGRFFASCNESPCMLFVYDVRPEVADLVPAIRHVDGTACAQAARLEQAPLFHRLIEQSRDRSGVAMLVNTSFNRRGKPTICTPQDALECFSTSPIDVLAIGALKAVHAAGMSVPEDLSLVGFDDIPFAAYTVPPLTTVRQPIEAMARLAIEIALRGAADQLPTAETHWLTPELVVRNSTARLSTRKEVAHKR